MSVSPDAPDLIPLGPYSHLGPASTVEKHVGRLEVAVNGLLAMQEVHSRADVPHYLPAFLHGQGLLGVLQKRSEVPAGKELHNEDQAVRQRRYGPVYVHRVRAS